MPSADSRPASSLSLSGSAGASPAINRRILARIAVADTPVPSSPGTWLEKK